MKNSKKIIRDIKFNKAQSILFILCLVFSIGTFISVDSIKYSIQNYVEKDSKALAGGDIIIESRREYSENITNYLNLLKRNPEIKVVNSLEFTTLVYNLNNNNSQLIEVEVLDSGYPLYGNVILENNNSFEEYFKKDFIITERNLIQLLNSNKDDNYKIGNHTFKITEFLISQPDVPLDLFKLGPKVLINSENLEEINLVGDKSRVDYNTYIKIESDTLREQIYTDLNKIKNERERIQYYYEEGNSLERFVDNFLFFIKLISIFIIFLSSVALTSILKSLLNELESTIAIKKVIGENSKSILKYYLSFVTVLSILGFFLSILFSYLLSKIFPIVFEGLIPKEISLNISIISIFTGLIITIFVVALFTYLPLSNIKSIRPYSIFRKEEINRNDKKNITITYSIIALFFGLLIFFELGELTESIYIILGIIIILLVLYILSFISLYLIKFIKNKINFLSLKLAINGLSRIGSKTNLIILSISLSLTLIFSLVFIEANLQNQFVAAFPDNSPNLFLLDIPKDDITGVRNLIPTEIEVYPVIRAPILEINGKSIKQINEELGPGEPVTRDFSITYTNLLKTEKIIDSYDDENKMFVEEWKYNNVVQVSVLDDIAQRLNLKLGDEILFSVQGIELKAKVVSFRTRTEEGVNAFFYFTFEEEVLKNAPQTVFATARVETNEITKYQNIIAKEYPQITVINGESTAKTIGDIIERLSSTVSFFTLFSLIGGILILISSIYATNIQRIKESVYYKLVGANKKLITKIFLLEYFIIGFLSSLIAVVFSLLVSFGISTFFLEINFTWLIYEAFTYLGITIIIIMIIGFISIRRAINKKPIEYIRENNIE